MLRLSCAALLLAACGGNNATQTDAPAGATVAAVSCAGITPAASITTTGNAYTPATAAISVGGVVQFTMPSIHNVISTTPGLAVDFGATTCLRFTAAGTYNFKCSVHLFTGSITVN